MSSKTLIVVISLTLLGNTPCMADAWKNANSRSTSEYRFSSVATVQTGGARGLFLTNSWKDYNTKPSQSFEMHTIFESGMAENISLMARNLEDGMTADEAMAKVSPRRVIGTGDEDLKPGYDLTDPSLMPVGDVPVMLLIVFAAMATYLRYRKLKAAQLVPTAQAAQPAE